MKKKIAEGPQEGIEAAKELYGVKSRILHSTVDSDPVLKVTLSSGASLVGESNIGCQLQDVLANGATISKVEAEKPVGLNPLVEPATLQAKLRVLMYGSPVTSTGAVFIPEGSKELWKRVNIDKHGPTAAFGNLMTDKETRYLRKASQQLAIIAESMGNPQVVSHVYLNDPRCIDATSRTRYADFEQYPVEADKEACQKVFPRAVVEVLPLAAYYPETGSIRHARRTLISVLERFI